MLESEIQKNTNQQHQGGGSSGGGVQHSIPDDLMVRSEDFFSAIHAIMSIKQNRHRIEGKNLKVTIFVYFSSFKRLSVSKKKNSSDMPMSRSFFGLIV